MFETDPDRGHASGLLSDVFMLTEEGWQFGSLRFENSRIHEIHGAPMSTLPTKDKRAIYVLPGIVDIHGDAFERHITPRAGTEFPLQLALAANDHALIGAGITSFFYSITDGFEPGTRSRKTARSIMECVKSMKDSLHCDSYLHIRHEEVNIGGHGELMNWLKAGEIDLLSLNNHLPVPDDKVNFDRYLAGLARREKMSAKESRDFVLSLQTHRNAGSQQTKELVAVARMCRIPLASHDDASISDVQTAIDRRVAIAEFPMSLTLAKALREHAIAVLLGAPNLVRGGSHVGGLNVKDAVAHRQIDALCSDYHYPSLFHAAFLLDQMKLMPLPEGWQLVSQKPAAAAGLGGRKGKLAVHYDADLLLLDRLDGNPQSIQSVFCQGNSVLSRSGNWLQHIDL